MGLDENSLCILYFLLFFINLPQPGKGEKPRTFHLLRCGLHHPTQSHSTLEFCGGDLHVKVVGGCIYNKRAMEVNFFQAFEHLAGQASLAHV